MKKLVVIIVAVFVVAGAAIGGLAIFSHSHGAVGGGNTSTPTTQGDPSANQQVCSDYNSVATDWSNGDVSSWETDTLTMGQDNANSNTAPNLDHAVRQYETDASVLTGTPYPSQSDYSVVAVDSAAISLVCSRLGN